jgi:hypothetical protein
LITVLNRSGLDASSGRVAKKRASSFCETTVLPVESTTVICKRSFASSLPFTSLNLTPEFLTLR